MMTDKQPESAVKFVSEGVTDIETQRAKEYAEQQRHEQDAKRRQRKSLREQLRANAISKQRKFNGLVKERDSFTRLSADELAFLNSAKSKQEKETRELQNYLHEKETEFVKRQKHIGHHHDAGEHTKSGYQVSPSPLLIKKNITTKKNKKKNSKAVVNVKQLL